MIGSPIWGKIAIIFSAVFFYLATFVIKKGSDLSIPVIYFAFSRFFIGFLFFAIYRIKNHNLIFHSIFWIRMRAFWNLVAVYFFFFGIYYGSVTNANILNMTYPAFVALFAVLLIHEKISIYEIIALFMTLIGSMIYISDTSLHSFRWGDVFSFLSAITAGVSIVSLRRARKTDSSFSILYYQFYLGTIISMGILILGLFYFPCECSIQSLFFLTLSAFFGVTGQIALTNGFRYVNATEGAILSSSRIWIALAVGLFILNENYTDSKWLGGAIIFAANVLAGYPKDKKT